ncbi:MAG: cysteine desulfurase [Clostridiales Family XIII bacterium]|jgi:cysteine desulfurase|nr:cysteine desulfurase [Clostridiales Family XIII bacterium]
MRIYLDNCSTTRVSAEAAKSVWLAMTENYANPSALHTAGQEAERVVKQARHHVAFALGAKPANIVFVSGGTEANNMALFSCFKGAFSQNKHLLVSAVEHPSVLNPAAELGEKGVRVRQIPVKSKDTDEPGLVDLKAFRELLSAETGLVSVMHVNNEIGTIQPIDEMTRLVSAINKERNTQILFHSDAVQSFGKISIDIENSEFRRVDLLSLSAHKIHGPKGIGALYARNPAKLHSLLYGGGQEGGLRAGTENVPGIAGFGTAARLATADIIVQAKQVNACRRRLLDGIVSEIPDVKFIGPQDASVTGKPGCSSPYILNVSFLGTRGEVVLHELEKSGIFVSTASACASLSKETAKARGTYAAIGLTEDEAEGAIRFGISVMNTPDEMDFVVDRLKSAVERFRRIGQTR